MKHSGNKLQIAYFQALTGDYDIHDEVPDDAEYPFIQISGNTFTDYTDNTSLGQEVTQTLWVVDRFEQAFGSRIVLNEITDFITQTIRARPVALSLEGFNVITSTLDIISFTKTRTDTHTYYRNEIRFRHLIEQLN